METFPSPYHLVLLSTRFRLPEQRLLFPSARLYFDRIELTGWHLHERFEKVIPLAEVTGIEWNATMSDGPEEAAATVFLLDDGQALPVQLDQLASWRHTLEHRLSWKPRRAVA